MPVNFGGMMAGARGSIVQAQIPLRAQIEWARIQDKPTDVELTRGERDLDPQTVRIEFESTMPANAEDASGISATQRVTLFGVQGHPDIDDFDVDAWDTFRMDDQEYTVVAVNRQILGHIEAYCEVVG